MSILRPIRALKIANRRVALVVFLVGALGARHVLHESPLANYVAQPTSKLDEFAPIYQFSETASIPVRASANRVYDAIFRVTAAEVPLYRTLAWLRRGGASGPVSVLNPPDNEPLVRVATRTSFMTLAEVPGREFVMGAVVMAPEGVRLAAGPTPESFRALTSPGFAKAAMAFSIEPQGPRPVPAPDRDTRARHRPGVARRVHTLLDGDRPGQPAHPAHVAAGDQGAG